ncbi:hypothetical protein DMH04_31125 [Kibdelosporangium aridum]|uniref:Uncharacterized protein n=1 Tax=Kibdelosporangium aridum TaxID=2030 RepID=A0A428Z2A5_KIBAR|nr:hypothetical protein [Kibdelosporangium aridum]RSM79443.1 hypothetical protein DMH04_31125 [Kibdelosporangium aridum]
MTVVLSARKHWCRPGEPVLFMWNSKLDKPRFEVEGLEPNGDPKRNVLTKAVRAVGKGALAATLYTADAIMAADGNSSDEGNDKDNGPDFLDILIFGPGPECMAVQAVQPWRKKQLPGWEDIHGSWVLTPQRLAWLVESEVVRKLAKMEEKGKPGLTGNLVRATAGVVVDVATAFTADHPAGKPVEFPEVEAGVEIPREAFRSVEVLPGHSGPVGEHERCYLQVVLADGSGLRLTVGRGPVVADLARRWISGG